MISHNLTYPQSSALKIASNLGVVSAKIMQARNPNLSGVAASFALTELYKMKLLRPMKSVRNIRLFEPTMWGRQAVETQERPD